MIPTVGRIVHYRLNANDAQSINAKRNDCQGNPAAEGEVYPALIVRNWKPTNELPAENAAVQLQVFVDGNFTYWATSRGQAADPTDSNLPAAGSWIEPPRL